ncbi:transmembrane protein, putative (macronuclear) [Tetrahymena thermophila SB210]|uniref:Transmembrane protein, putative n=1 Tax=Tetrahymena thermophila (strain SB210) TaxID=312017 RepID=W7XER7_TETTS|nr:transmembrane protein, putative [Tetrahymena thermophila SB210]EWS76267.1 transmembrane protein, putative [Tetrahymena thermophila SB210]|eukprot:XP_012651196.1 transmembrane protein, putative [Tetrahymena thermophila SB210]
MEITLNQNHHIGGQYIQQSLKIFTIVLIIPQVVKEVVEQEMSFAMKAMQEPNVWTVIFMVLIGMKDFLMWVSFNVQSRKRLVVSFVQNLTRINIILLLTQVWNVETLQNSIEYNVQAQ